MNQQDFERLLKQLDQPATTTAATSKNIYATEADLAKTVRLTPEEMAMDQATNQNPAVFAELEREYRNAKDPKVKAILEEEIRRQQNAPTVGSVSQIGAENPIGFGSAQSQELFVPSVGSSAGLPDFAGDKKRRDAQARSDASPISTSLGRGWERTKQMAGDSWNLATDDAEGVRQNALEWQKYDQENPAPAKVAKFQEDFAAAGDSVGDMLKAIGRNPGGFGLASVEQITNSLPSMAGSIAGSAIGATKGFAAGGPWGALAGSIGGGILGSAPGTFLIEPGAKVATALAESGVDLTNQNAVRDWFADNRDGLIQSGLIKAGTVAGFDGLMSGVGQAIVMRPAMRFAQAQNNALRKIGVDATDAAAVSAARQTDAYKALMAQPAKEFVEASTVAQKTLRGMAAFGAETYGEFGGEYYGEMLAEGEGNFNEAMLEALTAGLTSTATTASQFAAEKMAFGPDRNEIEIRELAAYQAKQQQAAPTPQPNSPLSNAAQAAVPQDPFADALAPITERLNDREIYGKIRGTEGLGSGALSDILASYRVATSTNADSMQRQAAIDRLNEFFSVFDNMPNFTLGGSGSGDVSGAPSGNLPVVPQQPGGPVGFVDPAAGSIEGEARQVGDPAQIGMQRRLPQPPRRLPAPPPALIADNREAQQIVAEYEAAFQDLVKADQLGASDQELMDRQVALRYAEARLAELNQFIESSMANQTAQKRDALLSDVLATIQPGQNPLRAFDRALKQQGFTDTNFTESEKAKIARFMDLAAAKDDQAVPSAPNEAGDFGIKEKVVSRTPATNAVANMLNSGWAWDGGWNLVSPGGQRHGLSKVERQFLKAQAAKNRPAKVSQPTIGEGNASESEQVAQEAAQANNAQAGAEQAAAQAGEVIRQTKADAKRAAKEMFGGTALDARRKEVPPDENALSAFAESGKEAEFLSLLNRRKEDKSSLSEDEEDRFFDLRTERNNALAAVENAATQKPKLSGANVASLDQAPGDAVEAPPPNQAQALPQQTAQTANVPGVAPVQALQSQPARDLSTRTDAQLAHLSTNGTTPEIRAAAKAELGKRQAPQPEQIPNGDGVTSDPPVEQQAVAQDPRQYAPPTSNKEASSRWERGSEMTPAKTVLKQAVEKALDSGLFYSGEVRDFVAKELSVTDAEREVGTKSYRDENGNYYNGVEGGSFGYEVYHARNFIEEERNQAANQAAKQRLGLSVGEVIGKIVPNDGKAGLATTVLSVGDQDADLSIVRGGKKYHIKGMSYLAIERAVKRAENDYFDRKAGAVESAQDAPPANDPQPAAEAQVAEAETQPEQTEQQAETGASGGMAEYVDDQVESILARFAEGDFRLPSNVTAAAGESRELANEMNVQNALAYSIAAKKFAEGDLTAKTPGIRDEKLNLEFLEGIQPKPVEKKVAKAKDRPAILKALNEIAPEKDIRYYLNGIHFDADGTLVVTDGHRAVAVEGVDTANIQRSEKGLTVLGRNGEWIDGKFPDWRRVMPVESGYSETFSAAKLSSAARAVMKASRYAMNASNMSSASMKVQVGDKVITVSASYTADMADFFRRMGHETFEVFALGFSHGIAARSLDRKVRQVVMGTKTENVFAPVGPDGYVGESKVTHPDYAAYLAEKSQPAPQKTATKPAAPAPAVVDPAQPVAEVQPAAEADAEPAPKYRAGDRVVPDLDVFEGDVVRTADGNLWAAKVKRGNTIPVAPLEGGRAVFSADTVKRIDLTEQEVTHTGWNIYGYGGQPMPAVGSMRELGAAAFSAGQGRNPPASLATLADKARWYAGYDEAEKAGAVTENVAETDLENRIKIAADSIDKLRKVDVERVLTQGNLDKQQMADYIKRKRPDLAAEVDDVMADIAPVASPKPGAPAVDAQNPAETTVAEKIRKAFYSSPVSIGVAKPITVEHNGVTQRFMAQQNRVVSNGKDKGAIHLSKIRRGRLLAGSDVQWIRENYRLTGSDQLVEEGLPTAIGDEEAQRFIAAFEQPSAVDAPNQAEAEAKREEFAHNGVRIYPTTVNVGGVTQDMWGVESFENKAKREAGERYGFGDGLFDTEDQAKAAADRLIRDQNAKAESDAKKQREAEESARKKAAIDADTFNGFLDDKAPNVKALIRDRLSKQWRFEGDKVMTARERIESLWKAGELSVSTYEEDKIKPMSRAQFNRATQREQDAHEKKVREGGKVTVYQVNGSDLGKTAYDYAQHLLNQEVAARREEAKSPIDLLGDPPTLDYRTSRQASNSIKILPPVGKRFSDQDLQSLLDWVKAAGFTAWKKDSGLYVVGDNAPDIPDGLEVRRIDKKAKADAERESEAKAKADARDAEYRALPSSAWIESTLGGDGFANAYNRLMLARFLDGKDSFKGLSSQGWFDPLARLGFPQDMRTSSVAMADVLSFLKQKYDESNAAPRREELQARIEAAEQQTNHDATPAQKEAGNYAKGKFAWNGLTVSVETAKGEDRTDKETNGDKWRVTMPATYGYILGTKGADKDHVDVFMGDTPESALVFVVNQNQVDSKSFDEHKVMAGFASAKEARDAYLASFEDGFGDRVLGSISGPYSVKDFRTMLDDGLFEKAKPIGEAISPLSMIDVEIDGQTKPADVALSEIDDQLSLADRLLSCVLKA